VHAFEDDDEFDDEDEFAQDKVATKCRRSFA